MSQGSKQAITSPPAGTGHTPGLGEAFNINLSTGQGMYSFKLPLPSGVAGHTPRLALDYAHGQGHSAFGFGWRVVVRTIARRLDFGVPNATAAERYLDSGSEIVPLGDGTFRAMVETTFTRYSRLDQGWKIEERNGTVHELGLNATARVADPNHTDHVHEWLLERTLDPSGNVITYRYNFDAGMPYLAEVRYATYAVRFDYEARPDARTDARMGFLRTRARRCNRITLVLDPELAGERTIRSWALNYVTDPLSGLSLLASIQMTSHGAALNGAQDVRRRPITFAYTRFEPQQYAINWITPPQDGPQPPPLSKTDVALITLDGAPLPGILQIINGKQYYWRNRGNDMWSYPVPLKHTPRINSFGRDGLAFLDMDASGAADLLVAADDKLQGYYENAGREGWARFVAFPRGQRATPTWTSPALKLADSNGDGRVDALMSINRAFALWRNQSEQGWSEPSLIPNSTAVPSLADPTVQLADMSGDGLQDVVRVLSGRVEYWPSLGLGRFGSPIVMRNSPRLRDVLREPQNVLLTDVNGDGCADLVHFTVTGIEVFMNQNGAGFADGVLIDGLPRPIPNTVRAANMRGRMGSGLVWNSYRGREIGYVQLELGVALPYLLTQIDNGAGLVSKIRYRSAVEDYARDEAAGELWQTHFPFPYLVVAGTHERDLVSGRETEIEFRYHEAHFEPRTRQFQGFRRTERFEKGDASRADVRVVFHFLMGQERLPGNGPEHAGLNGMLSRTETYSQDSSTHEAKPYRVETSDYGLQVLDTLADGRKCSFVFVRAHRVEDTERGDDMRGEEKTYTYDGLGNVLTERHRGYGVHSGIAQPERVRVTELTYAASNTRWLLDRTARTVVRDGNGTLISETRRYYDGPDFVGLPLGQADRGLMTREEQLVLSQAEFNAHYTGMNAATLGYAAGTNADGSAALFANANRCAYDARGLKTAIQDELGNTSSYVFDASGLFRIKLTDSTGTTNFKFDRAIGQIVRITYVDGTQAQFAYDAQGRPTATALPGETLAKAPRQYRYDDGAVPNARIATMRFALGSNGTARAVAYFDGAGKEAQQRVETRNGQFVVSGWRETNPWGEASREYEPTFSNSLAFAVPDVTGKPHRDSFYDGRGRVIRTVNYNGGVSTAIYGVYDVITSDANDNDASPGNVARGQFNTPRRELFDVLRYRTQVIEDLGNGAAVRTTYQVGPNGEVLSISDGHGVMSAYTYDQRGNRLVIQQRDAGTRRVYYDARNLVVRTLDANGNDIRATLDERGRLTQLATGGNVIEQYRYDDLAQHALGKLAEVSYAGGSQRFVYNAAGGLVTHEYRFDGVAAPHTLRYEHDLLGRELAVTHPDGTRIAKTLTPNGWVQAIAGFVDDVQYDPRGLPVQLNYHNGVATQIGYTPGPGRIKTQTTRNSQNQVLEDVAFEFDALEMLLASNDSVPGGVGERGFAYDPLYQLKGVTTIENGAPVSRVYDYADHYNLTRFDEAGHTMHYDDAAHPDRIAGLTPIGGARTNVNHDANGNLLDLPGRSFAYNAKNELARCELASGLSAEYRYDHNGERVSKRVDNGHGNVTQTLFIGDKVEIRGGQAAYFVRLGHLRVAVVFGGNTRFVHSDYLGSSAFFTDANGTKIAAIAYHPFGNVFSSSGNVDFRTFGAHPFDAESGLFYMQKRYYAPGIGRFLTPDPVAIYQPEKFLHNPKALHPYIYVANDPLNKTDPTGLSFWSVLGGVVGVIVGVLAAVAIVALTVMTAGLFGVFVAVLVGIGLTVGAFGVMAVAYVIASETSGTGFGDFMRGFLIGMNAGLNAGLASAIFGPVVGVALGVINFLAVFDGVAQNSFYQGVLGWSSWLMPMSWLATGVGLIFFVINLLAAGITGNQWEAAKIDSISIDWGTGIIVMSGGLIEPAGGAAGFNLGNFVFLKEGSGGDAALIRHETGHGLNVAAFGSLFHFVGALDENWPGNRGENAFAEQLAESHANRPGSPTVPLWG
jgi:RHS repeat-associated protein